MNSPAWKVGAAAVAITPQEPMWLAGWAARRQPANGKAMDLFAKAVAFEDASGERVIVVAADLIAIPPELAEAVRTQLWRRRQVSRERLLFNASHTHTGPEVRPDKVPFFEIPPEFAGRITGYVTRLAELMSVVIEAALDQLAPARLFIDHVRVGFAANRRSEGGNVDHEVPVLVASQENGDPVAILFGYACHNLTLPPTFCEFHGDYAGVAQAQLESRYPGGVALFLAGAGADQDPSPRGTPELVWSHGVALANEVEKAVVRRANPIAASLAVEFEDVTLDLQPVPPREALERDFASDDGPRRRKAGYLLAALAERRSLPITQVCPVQVVRFGRELLLIALGGEPVVDYALRFKREFAGPAVWVAGYSNHMFGYLPTRQIQEEGGYEAGRATLWSAVAAPLADSAEERVNAAVHRLVQKVRDPRARS